MTAKFVSETNSGGVLNGLMVSNTYDGLQRRTGVAVWRNGLLLWGYTNGYDDASRITSVSDGINSATYYYVANSSSVDHIDFAQNGAFVMRTQNTYDPVNRLISRVSLAPGTAGTNAPGTTPASFQYQYNAAGQRTRLTLADGSY